MTVLPQPPAGHPKRTLHFFVNQEGNPRLRDLVEELVDHLASYRTWTIAPPALATEGDDQSTDTVGGLLEIYSSLPPYSLPIALEQAHLDEVRAIVDALREFTRVHDLEFELELDGVYVGAVTRGVASRTLTLGLIDEWQRVLDEQRRLQH